MPPRIDIDPELLDRAVRVSGAHDTSAVVTAALREFVARHERRRIIELFGQLEWDDSCDVKLERTRRSAS